MIEPNPVDYLSDPLSEITRKERRNLLIASTFGVLVARAGLVPSKLSALGIDLSVPSQKVFVALTAVTVFYFVFAFAIYGASDFFVWRKKLQDYLEQVERFNSSWSPKDQAAYDDLHQAIPEISWLYSWSKPLAIGRIVFEFVVPTVCGLIAIAFLMPQITCS